MLRVGETVQFRHNAGMPDSPTKVSIGDSSFDIAAIGDWVAANVWLFLLVAFVMFVFFIFQKGGFAERFLDYRIRKTELEAKQLDDARVIADIFMRKHDREDPLLPFDDGLDDRLK
jgi:hypothetical protein